MANDGRDERCIADLLHARDNAIVTQSPSQRRAGFDLEAGYQIGHALHQRLLDRGFRTVGRKIGFTNTATWRAFNLQSPIWGHVYEQTLHVAVGGRISLSLDGMVAPRIEPEIVLKLIRPLPVGDPSIDEIASCLEWAALGFEIVDSHYANWHFTPADAVADFGVHAALIVGSPWRFDSKDAQRVAASLQDLTIALHRDREIVARGAGRNTLGSPLIALSHLATVLANQPWAPSLIRGEVITTGTLCAPQQLQRGELWRVEAIGAPLEPLELTIAD